MTRRHAAAGALTLSLIGLAASSAHADLITGSSTTLFRITDAGVVSTFATGGGINGARGLALGADGFLYVANNGAGNVLRYNPNDVSGAASATTFATVAAPTAIALDGANNVFVGNAASGLLTKFSPAGVSLFSVASSGVRGIAIGSNGNVYVSSSTTNDVKIYDPLTGAVLSTFATTNITGPREIEFGADGNLYVVNNTGNSVTRYDSTGAQIAPIPFGTSGINNPQGLTLDPSGNVYVTNTGNGLVRKFDSTGASLGNANATTLAPVGFASAYVPAVAVPEPGTFGLLALGLVTTGGGLFARRRRRAA